MKKSYKKLGVFVAVMVLIVSFTSNGFAADTIANLKAYYKNITVYKNGTQVNFSNEPFIVDGTTYVPLRDVSEVLDKDVTWDGTTYKIGINDKSGQNVNELYQQVLSLQTQNAQLQNENKNLKAKLEGSEIDLDDLEDQLNDDYDEIGDVAVKDIILDGDEDDIDVEIYINTTSTAQSDAWDDLDDDDIEDFLQDIVDDILDEFDDADISGFIEDEYNDTKVEKFSVSSKGKVELGGSSSGGNLGDLEDALNDDYDDIEGIDIEDIVLDGNEDDIEVEIYVDLSDEDDYDDWLDITDGEIEDFLQDIVDDILDEFEDADISGFIEDEYDNDELVGFSIDSDGYVELD